MQRLQKKLSYVRPTPAEPIVCPHCAGQAYLMRRTLHPTIKGEIWTFECKDCGKQTEKSVLHLRSSRGSVVYKGKPSSKTIAREFPFVVETTVPEGGLGRRRDDMHQFHLQRGITDHHIPPPPRR